MNSNVHFILLCLPSWLPLMYQISQPHDFNFIQTILYWNKHGGWIRPKNQLSETVHLEKKTNNSSFFIRPMWIIYEFVHWRPHDIVHKIMGENTWTMHLVTPKFHFILLPCPFCYFLVDNASNIHYLGPWGCHTSIFWHFALTLLMMCIHMVI